ncbi:TPA: hypothetical protein ACGOWO_001768 [Streptococcus suis]
MVTLEKIKNATSEALQRYSIVLEYKEALEKEQSEIEALKNQSKSAPSFALDKEIMERGKALPGFRHRLVTLARESKGDIKNLVNQANVSYYLDNSMKNDEELTNLKTEIEQAISDLKEKISTFNNLVDEKADHYLEEVRKTGFNDLLKQVNDPTYYGLELQDPTQFFNSTKPYNLVAPIQLDTIIKKEK